MPAFPSAAPFVTAARFLSGGLQLAAIRERGKVRDGDLGPVDGEAVDLDPIT